MPDLHFPAELPLSCVRDLIAAVRAGDYVSATVVDHALYAAGCLNAMRGPTPFGAGIEAAAECPCDPKTADLDTLADAVESGLPEDAPEGAFGAEAIPPWLLPVVMTLVQRLLDRWLKRSE